MKHIIHGALLFGFAALFFSCDKTESDCIYLDKRLCDPDYVPPIIGGEDNIVDFDEDLSSYESTVLLEDFTGYRCTNCPPATVTAGNLKDQHGDRLVVVAVHCTPYFAGPLGSDPDYFNLDFRTEEGEQYFEDYEFVGLPGGLVNRKADENEVYPVPFGSWGQRVESYLAEPAMAYIDIKYIPDISEIEDSIMVVIHARPLNNLQGSYNIVIGVIEDGIEEAQKYPTYTDYDYVHNHVFRGNINGPYGSPAFSDTDTLAADEAFMFEAKIPVNEEWNLSNCSVITYISNADTREIIQVDEEKIE